jgi:hypothetical protein
MKKTIKILIFTGIILIIISIIAANTLLKKKMPLSVTNLEQNIEFFEGVEFDITSEKQHYQGGENITVTAIITNQNTTNKTLCCRGTQDGALYIFSIYDDAYKLMCQEQILVYDNTTNPRYTGIFGSYNFTLSPNAKTICQGNWNQTYNVKNIQTKGYKYGQPVPPGNYSATIILKIAWDHYYTNSFPMRYFGKETKIQII